MPVRLLLLALVAIFFYAHAYASAKTLNGWSFFDVRVSTDKEWMTSCDALCGADAACLSVSSAASEPKACGDVLSVPAICRCMKPAGA